MKKNKILAIFLFLQILLIGSVKAQCDLKSFQFGMSHKALISQLKLDDSFIVSNLDMYSEVVTATGEKVCKNEKIFKDLSAEFLLLDDNLVEIRINRTSKSPTLFKWAESTYGENPNKPNSFYLEEPIAHWFWENPNTMITYSIEPYKGKVSEFIIIQSLKHQKYFDKLAIEL